jgi:membrane associated rhomboid family serine protease
MAYDDRDYFQSKPKFEFSSGLHAGTKGLMIALIAGYIAALVISDSLEYAGEQFWSNVKTGNEKAVLGYRLFVLVPQNILPIRGAFEPGYWKLLTHWLVAPGLITAIIDVLFVYMLGRMLEQLFGTKRYLALFIGACVLSGLLASLVDGWIVGNRISVVMGPSGGLIACLMAPVWIAPNQKSIFGWPLRKVTLGAVAIFAGIALLMGLFGKGPGVSSPTQLIWGAAIGAGYMLWLKRKRRLPTVDGTQMEEAKEPWEKEGYLTNYKGEVFNERKFLAAAEKQRNEEERAIKDRQADKQKLDKLLEKISASGIDSLSRKERKFLDEQSKTK